jgi:hypothetical protein
MADKPSETESLGKVATALYAIKSTLRTAAIVGSAVLLGISAVAALILATAPTSARVVSGRQIECMFRETVSLNWPHHLLGFKSHLESLQKFLRSGEPSLPY